MKLRKIGNNQTEIQTNDFNILVSYETPVACYNKLLNEYARTDKQWSATTTRHINSWLPDKDAAVFVEQSYLDSLLDIE